jgi:hypothetical protein
MLNVNLTSNRGCQSMLIKRKHLAVTALFASLLITGRAYSDEYEILCFQAAADTDPPEYLGPWYFFCGNLALAPYPENLYHASCYQYALSSYVEKINFCYNFSVF